MSGIGGTLSIERGSAICDGGAATAGEFAEGSSRALIVTGAGALGLGAKALASASSMPA